MVKFQYMKFPQSTCLHHCLQCAKEHDMIKFILETACEKLSNNGLNSDIQECLTRPKQDDMYCKCAD